MRQGWFHYKMAAHSLINRNKREAASAVQNEVCQLNGVRLLETLLDKILDPSKPINDSEIVEWCQWLIAGGRTPDEFSLIVKQYDNATACGLVWTANFIAYRCRTCGISPCMSLCAECFQRGNHEGHDFNMFRSQAGGACDCGDPSVMKESGFCNKHAPRTHLDKLVPPPDLLMLAETMMPRIFLRLIHHFRDKSITTLKLQTSEQKTRYQQIIQEAEEYMTMIHQFSELGAAMRHVMTQVLTDNYIYSALTEMSTDDTSKGRYSRLSNSKYQEMLKSLPFPNLKSLYEGFPDIPSILQHRTLLEELVFWTVIFEFPQKLVCLLLNMMPDSNYKEAFTRTFVQHYGSISLMLVNSSDSDTLSNRVVHVSVQLFSNETLTFKMANELHLLYIMVGCLKFMMSQILIQNTLHVASSNFNYVVDCSKDIMKDHCYWPLVSDLNNVLSHRQVALKFMNDTALLDMWFTFLSMFQGMNVNKRELLQHIEFEPNTYYSAFSAELEASASPMWAMISHLKEPNTFELAKQVLCCCLLFLEDWFDAVGFTDPEQDDSLQVSFHLPLHRYFAVFLSQTVRNQGADIDSLLPQTSLLQLIMMHPLRAQVSFYEILCGLWVRNGLQIKGQAMTYIQCQFCNSMVDADLYLLQVCAAKLDPDWFLMIVMERFHVAEWFSFSTNQTNTFLDDEQEMPMLESFLTFLATLLCIRTNIGLTDEELTKLEIVTLLCMSDKTHSQLTDLMPEKCGTTPQSKNFEYILSRVANYKAPNFEAGGHMLQGMYAPKDEVWEKDYDPMYVLLRAVHRRDYQTSLDRFSQYVRHTGKLQTGSTPWPPYRIPGTLNKPYINILRLLHCKTMHALIFIILYKALNEHNVSETAISLGIYLLEMAVRFPPSEHPTGKTTAQLLDEVPDMEFSEWFNGSWILTNVQHTISKVVVSFDPEPTIHEDSDDGCMELDVDVQELVENSSFDRGPRGDAGMLESSAQYAALPNVNIPLALPAAHSSQALVPVTEDRGNREQVLLLPKYGFCTMKSDSGNGQLNFVHEDIAEASTKSDSQPTSYELSYSLGSNMGVNENNHFGTSGSSMTVALSSSSGNQSLGVPERRRTRFRMMRMVPAIPNSTQNMALPSSQESQSIGPSMAVVPSMFANLTPPLHLKMHGATTKANMLQASESLPQLCGRYPPKALPSTTKSITEVNESILSLLIKLHSKLSGKPDSYTSTVLDDSRIGDGPHFIGQILNRISMLSLRAARTIQDIRKNLWPQPSTHDNTHSPENKENLDKNERRRRARERQQKLMAEFASKQKAFMEQTLGSDKFSGEDSGNTSQSEDSFMSMIKEYDCVICGQTTPSTEERPVGLVCLLQASSVLGHCYSDNEHLVLPCSDEEWQLLRRNTKRADELNRRIDEFTRFFDMSSWLLSLSIGLEGGIHVQTCGHHLHLDCHKSYIHSLRSQQSQRQQSLAIDIGEYSCPLCRQLANSVLPVSPNVGEITALVQCRENDQHTIAMELAKLIQSEPPTPQQKANLTTAMSSIMEEMTKTTSPQYKCRSASVCRESIFLFISSIARTNLELEIIQRGGTLCLPCTTSPKRPCFIPLLHVLAMHSKILSPKPYTQIWAQITGLQIDDAITSLSVYEREVPLLLKDITALLLQLVLILPLHIDKAYFTCIVRMLFNVVYVKCLAQLSCRFTEQQRLKWKQIKQEANDKLLSTLPSILGEIIDILEHSRLYEQDEDLDEKSRSTFWNTQLAESFIRQNCLPFLRVASLLQSHVYKEELPSVTEPEKEFNYLVMYLGILSRELQISDDSAVCVSWLQENPVLILQAWCQNYMAFVDRIQITARSLLNQPQLWAQPKLLNLPVQYEKFFQYYHRKHCQRCNLLPKEPSVCLICGTLVCLREACCRQISVFEAVQHSMDCGAGTAMFLAVNSSNIIVIRGKRVCLWGSVYLDSYGEEDKDLKRGKPLFLCHERYRLLEHQWLTHSFDHTTRRWIWHKDVL